MQIKSMKYCFPLFLQLLVFLVMTLLVSTSSLLVVTAQTTTTTTTAPPPTTTSSSSAGGNATTSAPAATTSTTTTFVTTSAGGGTNGTGNGTTAAPAAATAAETQTLQWYHVAVAVAIGFLLAFGTCYAVCVWQQTAVRDYEGGLENFLKEVGLLRRQLADEVEEREEMQAKTGITNELFEKYKTEQEAIQAEADKKEALRKNLADVGGGGGGEGEGGKDKDKKDAAAKDAAFQSANTNRTQNMISFKQQRAAEIKNLQALSRIGSPLGAVGAGSTGRLVAEPMPRYAPDPRFSTTSNRNTVVQAAATDTGPKQTGITDPLQLALADALNTQRVLMNLRSSAQMRSLATQSEL